MGQKSHFRLKTHLSRKWVFGSFSTWVPHQKVIVQYCFVFFRAIPCKVACRTTVSSTHYNSILVRVLVLCFNYYFYNKNLLLLLYRHLWIVINCRYCYYVCCRHKMRIVLYQSYSNRNNLPSTSSRCTLPNVTLRTYHGISGPEFFNPRVHL